MSSDETRSPAHPPLLVGIGELLWDLFPQGKALGGAPANFAYHARALGADSALISRIGTDELGEEIVSVLDARGVETALLQRDPDRPTGTVTVEVDAAGKPVYVIHEGVAWDHLQTTAVAMECVGRADAVCFGSLAQRHVDARAAIRALVEATPAGSLRVLDVNLRQQYYSRDVLDSSLQLANVLKLSDEELPVIAAELGVEGDVEGDVTPCLERLADRYGLRLVALTRGGEGSLLWANGEVAEHAGIPVELADTVGAGDSFVAATALGFLAGHPLARIGEQANRVAAFVCSQDGAVPAIPEKFARWFDPPGE